MFDKAQRNREAVRRELRQSTLSLSLPSHSIDGLLLQVQRRCVRNRLIEY